MEFLCAGLASLVFFAFIAFVLIAVARGTWILVGQLFCEPSAPSLREHCPCCDWEVATPGRRCRRCGFELESNLGDELAELRGAARQVKALADRGDVTAEVADDLYER